MFNLFVNIVWLVMSTRKYASGYEKLKKKKKDFKLNILCGDKVLNLYIGP